MKILHLEPPGDDVAIGGFYIVDENGRILDGPFGSEAAAQESLDELQVPRLRR